MKMLNKQIVCISPHYWKSFWFRKQHFMSRFHKKGYKIAYIDPSFSIVRKPNISISAKGRNINSFLGVKIEEVEDNLFIISPPRYLPFHTKPIIRELNYLYIFFQLAFILKKLGFQNYILWLYKVEHIDCIKYLNNGRLIFDITDDLAAYEENNKRKYLFIEKCTKFLIQKSDLVFVTASTLFTKFKSLHSDIHLIPNGYDSSLFSRENVSVSLPELENVHRPIIGFVGNLFPYLDYDLIEYIVKKNPKKTFVFVGPCRASVKIRWEKIIKYNNVTWVGRKEKEEVPSIVDKFDVCINPFKIDNLSKSVSPLKVFEYLAMKKPVVSVEMESLKNENVGRLIYFAKDYGEFNHKINLALKNAISSSEYRSIEEYSWDNLFNKVFDLVEELCKV